MPNAELFTDLSSNNALPSIAAYAKAGHKVIALKATESNTYTWDAHSRLADEAHKHHLTVLHYAFVRPGSALQQAEHFLAAVNGHTAAGDGLVIDCEVPGVNGRFVTAFLNRLHRAHPNLQLWIYGGGYFLRDKGIKPVHGAKLWLADYTTGSKPDLLPPGWPHYDAWQYTDRGTVKGVAGHVDVSRLRVESVKPKPTPKPKKPVPHKPAKAHRSWWIRAWRRWMRGHI